MFRYGRYKTAKFYAAFIAVTTLMIATDIIQFTTSPFAFKIGKEDHFIGQFEINLRRVKQEEVIKKVPTFVKIKDARVYLFSAIISYSKMDANNQRSNYSLTNVIPTAVLSGWEQDKYSLSNFTCCYKLKDGEIISRTSSRKSVLFIGKTNLQAKQFKCPIDFEVSNVKEITITIMNGTCPTSSEHYIPPTILKPKSKLKNNTSNIAVCLKLVYGSLDARRLIEWFEVNRLLGVDKVLAYKYHLNSMAKKVLEYYEKKGFAAVYNFDIPEKEFIERDVGVKNMQAWNDEQIVVFDCQERLKDYDYVAVIDTDEFIVPTITKTLTNAWKIFLDKKLKKSHFAGLLFSVRVHADTWGPSIPNHPLHIGRYGNSTLPMFDRIKGVYMPSRVQPGSVATHMFRPLNGYKRGYVHTKEATIHHFRSCRKEWLRPCSVDSRKDNNYLYYLKNTTKCYDLRRSPSKIMSQVANAVKDKVLKRIQEIGI